jgi:hypothetical protein
VVAAARHRHRQARLRSLSRRLRAREGSAASSRHPRRADRSGIRDSGAGVLAGGVARHAPYPRPSVRAPAGPEAWTGDERDRRPRDRPPSTHRSATRGCVSHRAPCEARVSSHSLS